MDARRFVTFALGLAITCCLIAIEGLANPSVGVRESTPSIAARYHQRSRVPSFYRRSRGRVVRHG